MSRHRGASIPATPVLRQGRETSYPVTVARPTPAGRGAEGTGVGCDDPGASYSLQPDEALGDQNVERDAAVLCLAFVGAVVRKRICLCHAGGSEHAIGLPAAGLLQIIDHAAGALFAEHLVEFFASC